MSSTWSTLGVVAGGGALVAAGALLSFSTFTMRGLAALPEREGAAAMRAINDAAPRSPLFMAVLFAPAALGAACAVAALPGLPGASSALTLGGALTSAVGVVGATVAVQVPRNTALAGLDDAAAARAWPTWRRAWVRTNHVRVASGVAAGVMLAAGGIG